MVIKRHKAESSLFSSGALLHDINAFNLPIFLKILPNMVFLGVLLDTTDKDLLHRQMGARFIRVLQQRAMSTSQMMQKDYLVLSLLVRAVFTSLDTALLGSTIRPSTLWGLAFIASSTSVTDEYVTKPKPLDRLLVESLIT